MSTNFPSSLDNFFDKLNSVDDCLAGYVNSPQEVIEELESKVGITSSADTSSFDYKINNFFTTGRKVWLYENTAPTGWSIVSLPDTIIAVKGGTEAYNVTGGNTAGTWTQPDHTLITAEMPAHTHTEVACAFSGYNANTGAGVNQYISSAANTGSAGSGGAHNHGTTWRPAAAVGIIVQKS